ncbi:uncharacterized ATP-dependent helicase YprA isoform X1 [Rosa chinensis]|nr:uncharacterized ATP-dependent helicase YprA isoform X1 [Rosa chinensis]
MAATRIQIEVRTLTGEATTVSASVNDAVSDLKLLLNQSFPPATNSPNFHLFFKGEKLRLQSRIGTHGIKPGEVLVLVPFVKKVANNQSQKCDQSDPSLNTSANRSMSKFANSAWSDMMQDLSYLRDGSSDGTPSVSNIGSFSVGDGSGDCSCEVKRKRGFGCDEMILDMLWASRSKSVLDEQNSRRFVELLESVNCLSDPYSGDCMLWRRKASLQGFGLGLPNSNGNSCLCPEWLKKIMKGFAFLNIFSALVQLQQERTTSTLLEQALKQLATFGVKLDMQDMEHLSVISPKVVLFVKKNAEETSSGNALVIIECSAEQNHGDRNNHESASKQMDVSKIVNELKMQESSFKSNLWEAVERLMFIKRNEISSLEDFLISVKDCGAAARGNKVNQATKSHTASTTDSDKKHSAASTSRSHKKRALCHRTGPLLPVEMVEHLRKRIGSATKIVHVEDIGARNAVHVEVPQELSENLRSVLHSIGITQLYSHQAESIQASLTGKNVVVATMTSSGKSLCYNLPVIEALSQSSSSCALYLFPTKALAQDQLRAFLAMTKGFSGSLNVGIYDGDTNQQERTRLRQNARLLITNPDMLHVSILPHHRKFGRILANLRYVVIDEAHVYNGAFGCHTALILRRLRRLCSHVYGSDPSFVFSTATSANPREHCMELANLPTLELIQNDGSPAARKLFILWNSEDSAIEDISFLFAEMVQHGLRCIAFCKTRKLCELVFCHTREILQETAPHLAESICSYRAGYIAEDRRRIESDLFNGKLSGIAATNALELGIDVGHIDVTLHLGFPGSIASLWQQAGRAGRRERPSLAVYVAFEGPLDQYFMKHPNKLFGSPIECCHVDAKNQQVLEQHLACAALEHPLSLFYDGKFFGSGLNSAIMSLKSRGFLSYDPSCDSAAKIWNYIGYQKMPSHSVSIRSIERERYKVMDDQEKEIEEIEESKAFFQVYEGAVYLNQGKTYLVTSLDLSSKIAWCQKADVNYYTKPRDRTDIHVVGGNVAYPAPAKLSNQFSRTTARADPCRVTTTWFGFYRVHKGSNMIFDKVNLALPKYTYTSQAVWVPVPRSIIKAVESKQLEYRAGLHAASHAVLHVVPLRIICNLSDLAPECADPHDGSYFPERILLYDQHPGGTGVCVQVHPFFMELLATALELLTSCHCREDDGCPNCIQSFCCKSYNEVLHKDAAIMIIKGILDANISSDSSGS